MEQEPLGLPAIGAAVLYPKAKLFAAFSVASIAPTGKPLPNASAVLYVRVTPKLFVGV